MTKENNIAGFHQFTLPLEETLFQRLKNSVDFEDIAKGRKGNHLVNVGETGIPIVRTTSKYNQAAHNFSDIHHSIINSIKNEIDKNDEIQLPTLSFNNALIEIYNRQYAKMGYHSDQSLDLENDSYIALFSCYESPDDFDFLRKLKVKSKETNEEYELTLTNNSVILFSLPTNFIFSHKIILDSTSKQKPLDLENRWLGITFRQSKTFIQFKDHLPFFQNGQQLTLADENQQKEFYKLRGQEKKSMRFEYPSLSYTLSKSDLMKPKGVDG